jgi:ribosomal protein S18 acetylase RimI-like enzyme
MSEFKGCEMNSVKQLEKRAIGKMSNHILIRDFRKSDLGDLLELLPLSFAEEFEVTGFDPDHVREMVDQMFGISGQLFLGLTGLFGKEPAKFFVAEVDNRVVGTTIVNNKGRVGYISTVMVHPNYRRKSIATRLMQSAVNYIRKKKMTRAVLHVVSTNIPAKNVYTKLGFKKFENVTYLIGETDSLVEPKKTEKVAVRLFQNSDIDEVCNLIKMSEDPNHLRIFDFGKDDLKTPLWQRLIHFSKERRIVAVQNDRIVGYAEVSYTTPKEASRIENVQVCPEHRSNGIEEALIDASIDQIRQSGAKRIRVTAPTIRQELIEIFENPGFRKHLEMEGMFLEI